VDQFAHIGIGPGKQAPPIELTPVDKEALADAVKEAFAKIEETTRTKPDSGCPSLSAAWILACAGMTTPPSCPWRRAPRKQLSKVV
jgi:hypothetical protein